MIAALYVERNGVYFGRADVDPWDEARDARTYDGPHAIVAHPPCGPWGMFRHMCTKQDARCGPLAVEAVRRWGGVLEHPAHSRLWDEMRMPYPGELTDGYGWSLAVNQVSWGHVLTKPTWLYFVGIDSFDVCPRRGGVPTRRMTSGPTSRGYRDLPMASAQQRRMTPPAFADWLITLAHTVRR